MENSSRVMRYRNLFRTRTSLASFIMVIMITYIIKMIGTLLIMPLMVIRMVCHHLHLCTTVVRMMLGLDMAGLWCIHVMPSCLRY